MSLSDAELERYARHIVLREIGGAGQLKLKAARALVVGAGGIGSPAIQYLAAAGVGELTMIDDDHVSLSNLQRQTLYATEDVGLDKIEVAFRRVRELNPEIRITGLCARLDAPLTDELLTTGAAPAVVIDGTDNFDTRLAVADACLHHHIPLVSAAVTEFEGQLGVFRGWEPTRPCYRCFVGTDPEREGVSCSEQGVLGALAGVMGSLAALEAIRAIVPFGTDSAGKLLLVDALDLRFRTLTLPKDPGCRTCAALH